MSLDLERFRIRTMFVIWLKDTNTFTLPGLIFWQIILMSKSSCFRSLSLSGSHSSYNYLVAKL